MSGASIEFRHASCASGGRLRVDDVTLSIAPGEFVAVAGASGCGKSTLLKLLVGVEHPTSGDVLVDAQPPVDLTGVGYVAQTHQLHTRLTPEDAIRLVAELYPDTNFRMEDTEQFLHSLGLHEQIRRRISDLSGGERRRVSLALELAKGPDLLICDEPTSGLDPVNESIVLAELRNVIKSRGTTTLVATHAARNLRLFDRVIIFGPNHQVAYDGTPSGALERYDVIEFEEIYERLGPPREVASLRDHVRFRRPETGISWARQFRFFLTRDVSLLFANPWLIAFTAGSPAAVTALLVLQWDVDAFKPTSPFDGLVISFVISFVPFFYGLLVACGAIVNERQVVDRELQLGASPIAYMAAKLTLYSGISLLIAPPVWFISAYRFEVRETEYLTLLLLTLVLLNLSGAFLGLVISVRAKNVAVSIYIAIALTLLSLVLPGPLSLSNNPLSPAFPIQWGYSTSADALFGQEITTSQRTNAKLTKQIEDLQKFDYRTDLAVLLGLCVATASIAMVFQITRDPTGDQEAVQ